MSDEVVKKPVLSRATQAGLDQWDSAAAQILRMSEEMIRRVPEPYFEAKILPIVRNWVQGLPTEVGEWMNVADGMEREIVVVDAKNNELFRCPPPFIAIPPRSEFGDRNQKSATAIVHAQGLMYDVGELRQAEQIEENLLELVVDRPDVALKTKAMDGFIAIYLRYKLPMQELLGQYSEEILTARGVTTLATEASKGKTDDSGEDETFTY